MGLIIPILSARVIIYLTDNKLYQLINISVIILLCEISYNLLYRISRKYMNTIYHNTLTKLEVDLGSNILKLESKIINEKGSGIFIQRLTSDTSRLADIYVALNIYLTSIITEIGMYIVVFMINKLVFLYLVLMTIIMYIVEKIRNIKFNNEDKKYRKSQEKVSGFITELVRGSHDIKMLNAEDSFINELENKIVDSNEKRLYMQKIDRKYRFYLGNLTDINEFLLIVILVILIMNNQLAIASALVISRYTNSMRYLISNLGVLMEKIKDFYLAKEYLIF